MDIQYPKVIPKSLASIFAEIPRLNTTNVENSLLAKSDNPQSSVEWPKHSNLKRPDDFPSQIPIPGTITIRSEPPEMPYYQHAGVRWTDGNSFLPKIAKIEYETQESTDSDKSTCGIREDTQQRREQLANHTPTLLAHTTWEIANILAENANKLSSSLSQMKREALDDMERFPEKYLLGTRQPEDLGLLDTWILLFDKLFFFDIIHKHTEFKFLVSPEKLKRCGGWCEACFEEGGEEIDFPSVNYLTATPKTTIVAISLQAHEKSPNKKFQRYLEVLQHEMIHAYFALYTCECDSCYDKVREIEGYTGHGIG